MKPSILRAVPLITVFVLQSAIWPASAQAPGGSGCSMVPRIVIKTNHATFTKGFGSYTYKAKGNWSESNEYFNHSVRYSDDLILGNQRYTSSIRGRNQHTAPVLQGGGSGSYLHKTPTLANPSLRHADAWSGDISTEYPKESVQGRGRVSYSNPESALLMQNFEVATLEGPLKGHLYDWVRWRKWGGDPETVTYDETGTLKKKVEPVQQWIDEVRTGRETLTPDEYTRPKEITMVPMPGWPGMPWWASWENNVVAADGMSGSGSGKYGSYDWKYEIQSRHTEEQFINQCRTELGAYLSEEGRSTLVALGGSAGAGEKESKAEELTLDGGTAASGSTPIITIKRKFTPDGGMSNPATLETGKAKYQVKSDMAGRLGGMILAIETREQESDTQPTILKVRSWVPTPGVDSSSPEWELEAEHPAYKQDGIYKVWIVGVSLKEIGFEADSENFYRLISDSGITQYNAPHWHDENEDRDSDRSGAESKWTRTFDPNNPATYSSGYPVAYKGDTFAKTSAKFKVPNAPSWLGLRIKAPGSVKPTPGDDIGCGIPPTSLTKEGGTYLLQGTKWRRSWPKQVRCFDWNDKKGAYKLDWKIEVVGDPETDDVSRWRSLYATYHRIYICLEKPLTLLRQESLFDISCNQADGQNTKDQVFEKVWQYFETKWMQRAGDRRANTGPAIFLQYWGSWASQKARDKDPDAFDTIGLMKIADGRCKSWQLFLIDLLRIHGDDQVFPGSIFPNPAKLPARPEKGQFTIGVKNSEWIQGPPIRFERHYGMEAQGNDNPGGKQFPSHAVTRRGTSEVIYDPSYGRKSPNLNQWEVESLNFIARIVAGEDVDTTEKSDHLAAPITIYKAGGGSP